MVRHWVPASKSVRGGWRRRQDAMIERALADVEAGRTISDGEMKRTIESWHD